MPTTLAAILYLSSNRGLSFPWQLLLQGKGNPTVAGDQENFEKCASALPLIKTDLWDSYQNYK